MWRETTKHERNLKIFREELDSFLPGKILDFHVHVFNDGVIPDGAAGSSGSHAIPRYDYVDLKQDLEEVYPGRDTYAVCFGFPDPAYDARRNNNYVASACEPGRFFPLRLLDPVNDTPEILRRDLVQGRYFGVKPYPSYLGVRDVNEVELHEMLPVWAMEIVDELGLMVMLHLPRKARIADPLNQRQLRELCQRFTRSHVVLAYAGRAYHVKNIVGCLEPLRDLTNLYIDLAMVSNWELVEHVIRTAHPERILYGTDMPMALAPGKSIEINDQYAYVTPEKWAMSVDDPRKLAFTSFLYEELRAIKKVVTGFRLSDAYVRGLFFDNGMNLLQEVNRARDGQPAQE